MWRKGLHAGDGAVAFEWVQADARGGGFGGPFGEHFAGVGDGLWVELRADAFHEGDAGGVEHFGEELTFFDSDAMFTGDGATELDAEADDLGGDIFSAVEGAGDATIEEDEWVEVSVSGVEDIGDGDLGSLADALDFAKGEAEFAAWDDAILDDEIGAQSSDGGEDALATFPDEHAFIGVGGDLNSAGTGGLDELFQALLVAGYGFAGAIELDDEDGLDLGWIFGTDGGGGGLHAHPIHDLHGGGEEPCRDDGRDGITGLFDGIVTGEDGVEGFGFGEEAEGELGGDAEESFATAEEAEPIGAILFEAWVAERDEFAGGEDDASGEDMVAGHAVFEAVCAAGIEGDVAADGADLLAAGVGGEVETVRGGGLGDVEIDDARFDDGDALEGIEFEDLVHLVEGDDDAIGDGE